MMPDSNIADWLVDVQWIYYYNRIKKCHAKEKFITAASWKKHNNEVKIMKGELLHKTNLKKWSKYHCLGTTLPFQIMEELIDYFQNPPETKKFYYCMAICYHFIEVPDAPYSTCWRGNAETILIIRKVFCMAPYQRRVIKIILEE